jgi:hypothetical protein
MSSSFPKRGLLLFPLMLVLSSSEHENSCRDLTHLIVGAGIFACRVNPWSRLPFTKRQWEKFTNLDRSNANRRLT